jgi:ABC-type transport system involved in cytochrome c biogenesis permease subunit
MWYISSVTEIGFVHPYASENIPHLGRRINMNKSYKRFSLIIHSIITLFALAIICSSIIGWEEMDRSLLYLLLGISIFASGLTSISKTAKQRVDTSS